MEQEKNCNSWSSCLSKEPRNDQKERVCDRQPRGKGSHRHMDLEGLLGCSVGGSHSWQSLDTQRILTLLLFPRLLPARRKPRWKAPELKWPSIYQALQCHEITCVSALWEKPDLSVIGSDMFNISLCSQERAAELLGRKELSPWSSFLPEC